MTGQPALQSGDAGIAAMTGSGDTQMSTNSGSSTQGLSGQTQDFGSPTTVYTSGKIDAAVANEISSIIAAEINQLITNISNNSFDETNGMGELGEVSEEELGLQQKLEDDLVQQAMSGDTGEDAQSALMGYNPSFRQYVQPQMKVNEEWYGSEGVYTNQQN